MIYRTIGMPMCKPWRSPKSDGQDELLLRALQSLRDGILRPQATTGGWNLWWWLMDTDGKHGESHITTMVPRGDSGRWMAFLFRFRALGQSSDFLLEMIDGPMVDFHGLSETILAERFSITQ